ncbi:MAG: type 1 glutamine amidotransferase domain-containing protein [Acidimicrobiia bacterium]
MHVNATTSGVRGVEQGDVDGHRVADRVLVGRAHPSLGRVRGGGLRHRGVQPRGRRPLHGRLLRPLRRQRVLGRRRGLEAVPRRRCQAARLEDTRELAELSVDDFDVVFLVGGQGPMETFHANPRFEGVVREFYEAGKPTTVVCHATSVLLTAPRSDGRLIVEGKRWTGFSSAEERYVEDNVGQRFQPFWIEEEAAKLADTTFVAGEPMTSHVVVDGNLVTGQQQHSGAEAARRAIDLLA